jgi:signal transduction histidine kinase
MILIVDDVEANIIALTNILELHNLPCESASSGEEGLKMILKKKYSLIILDVQMPGMDGFEVAEALAGSNNTKDIPVIFLSAINKQKKYISRGYETGAVDYITKPVDPDLFILKVKTFLKLFHQKNELKNIRDLLAKEIEIRKRAEEGLEVKVAERTRELIVKNEELEFRNHELQQFAWVVSHDLKEPIRKIEIFLRMIRDKYIISDPKADDYILRTLNAANRMQKLISDLLDYTRLSSEVTHEVTDLNQVLNEVVQDFDFQIEEKSAAIQINELPNIKGNKSQIRQVFHNLIGNSLKFNKPGVPPFICIKAEKIAEKAFDSTVSESGHYCRITVSDNGIGFEEQYLDKIFIIFQSLNSPKIYEGTGIGLAIAKKIIEKHNGLITATSQPGVGSCFYLILPIS